MEPDPIADDDGIPCTGPSCPECGREQSAEPIASPDNLGIAYVCAEHGIVSLDRDPFGDAENEQ
jgi:hypothetical protein